MKPYLAMLIAAFCISLPVQSHAIEGFPGSTWGDVHWEDPHPGENDVVADGWIRQGVAWANWHPGESSLLLDTYITTRYYVDSVGFDWFNYVGPGGGVSLDFYAPHGPAISVGGEYIHQMNFRSTTEQPYAGPFVNWYHWWDLHQGDFPGSTWGDVRWEFRTDENYDDLLVEGWIRQGIVLKRWETENRTYVIDPYVRVRYKYDSRGLDWNNYAGPGAGIALDMESPNGPLFSLGAEYGWEKQWQSGSDINRVEVYLRWYAWWDLKK